MRFTPHLLLMRRKHWIAVSAVVLIVVAALFAQQVPTFSVNVKVVNVLATVRDKHAKIVNTLTQDDFTLAEDGRPQTIKYFRRETDMPLTLGLLVDTSLSQIRVIDEERTASAGFTNDVMRADKDSAFLIQFDSEVELLQDLTTSPLKIQSALDLLHTPHYDDARNGGNTGGNGGGGYPGGGGGYPGGGGGYPGGGYPGGGRGGHGGHGGSGRGSHGGGAGGGTLLYDSIYLASNELMQKQQGRKALIVLTDGDDHGSKMSLETAVESAQRADTMVYSIYFTGVERMSGISIGGPWGGHGGGWPTGGGGNGKKVLERLSKETGGRMFEVSKKESLGQIYAEIQDELRNQYNIGYSPDRGAENTSDYHKIQVATKQKDLTVQARDGYYASRQADSTPGK